MIAALWVTLFVEILLSLIDKDYSTILTTFLSAILWTKYFQMSVRVKNTFVNKRKSK